MRAPANGSAAARSRSTVSDPAGSRYSSSRIGWTGTFGSMAGSLPRALRIESACWLCGWADAKMGTRNKASLERRRDPLVSNPIVTRAARYGILAWAAIGVALLAYIAFRYLLY